MPDQWDFVEERPVTDALSISPQPQQAWGFVEEVPADPNVIPGPAPPRVRLGHEQEDWNALSDGAFYMDPFGQRRQKSMKSQKQFSAKPLAPPTMEMGVGDALTQDVIKHVYEHDEVNHEGIGQGKTLWYLHADKAKREALSGKVEQDQGSWLRWGLEHVPGPSLVTGAVDTVLTRAAEQRIQRGDATDDDFSRVARSLAESRRAAERAKRPWYDPEGLARFGADMGTFVGEMAATAGVGRAAKLGMIKLAGQVGSRNAQKWLVKNAGGKALLWTAEGLGRASLLAPAKVPGDVLRRGHKGGQYSANDVQMMQSVMNGKMDPTMKDLMQATGSHYIEIMGEQLGGPMMNAIPGMSKLRQREMLKKGLAAGMIRFLVGSGKSPNQISKIFKKGGYDGMVAEVMEELAQQGIKGVTGAEDDYATLGKVFNPSTPEERAQGLNELARMAAGFTLFSGGKAVLEKMADVGEQQLPPPDTLAQEIPGETPMSGQPSDIVSPPDTPIMGDEVDPQKVLERVTNDTTSVETGPSQIELGEVQQPVVQEPLDATQIVPEPQPEVQMPNVTLEDQIDQDVIPQVTDPVPVAQRDQGLFKVSNSDVRRAFPGRRVTPLNPTETDLGGWRVEVGDTHMDIKWTPQIQYDWEQIERQEGRQFSQEERDAYQGPLGAFTLNVDGSRRDGVGLIQMAAELANKHTLDHEKVHFLRQAGILNQKEWDTLVRKYSKLKLPGTSGREMTAEEQANLDRLQEEDVAKAYTEWRMNQGSDGKTLGERFVEFVNRILEMVGLKAQDAQRIFEAFSSESMLARPVNLEQAPQRVKGEVTFQVRDALENMPQKRATPQQVARYLSDQGATEEQVSEVMASLEGQKSVTKDAMLQAMKPKGRPDLANPAEDADVRREVVDQADEEYYTDLMGYREDAEVYEQARQQYESDPEGVSEMLLERARGGGQLSDVETLMAQRFIDAKGKEVLARQKPGMKAVKEIEPLKQLVLAYRMTGAEQARALRARRDPRETPFERRQRAIVEMVYSTPDPKVTIDALRDAGYDLSNMEELDKFSETEASALQVLYEIRAHGSAFTDKMLEYWKNSILSGPLTHSANMMGFLRGIWGQLAAIPEAALNAGMQKLNPKWGRQGAQLGEFRYVLEALLPNFAANLGRAWRTGADAFMKDQDAFNVKYGLESTDKSEGRGHSIRGMLGRTVRLFGMRPLNFMDNFAKQLTADLSVGAHAYRLGVQIRDIMNGYKPTQGTPQNVLNAVEKLKKDGKQFDMTEFIKQEVANTDSLSWSRSIRDAIDVAFQGEGSKLTEGVKFLGKAATGGHPKTRLFKPMGFVIPFVNTPVNILAYGLRNTPLGMFNLAIEWNELRKGEAVAASLAEQVEESQKKIDKMAEVLTKDQLKKHPRYRAHQALKRRYKQAKDRVDREHFSKLKGEQLLAVAVLMTLASSVVEGEDEADDQSFAISGTDHRRHPQSIKLGDTWYSYRRIEPFATMFATMVDVMDGVNSGRGEVAVGKTWSSFTRQINDKSYLQGIRDLSKAIEAGRGDTQYSAPKALTDWASRFTTSWVPNIVRQPLSVSKDFRDERRVWGDGSTVPPRGQKGQMYLKRIGQGIELPQQFGVLPDQVKVDVWGRPIERNKPDTNLLWRLTVPLTTSTHRPTKGDLVIDNFNTNHPDSRRIRVRLPDPYYTVAGKRKWMTEEQYNRFAKESGKLAREMVDAEPFTNILDPTEADAKRVQDRIRSARAEVKKLLVREWEHGDDISEPLEKLSSSLRDKRISTEALSVGRKRPRRHGESDAVYKSRVDNWELNRAEGAQWVKDSGLTREQVIQAILRHNRRASRPQIRRAIGHIFK